MHFFRAFLGQDESLDGLAAAARMATENIVIFICVGNALDEFSLLIKCGVCYDLHEAHFFGVGQLLVSTRLSTRMHRMHQPDLVFSCFPGTAQGGGVERLGRCRNRVQDSTCTKSPDVRVDTGCSLLGPVSMTSWLMTRA